MVSLIRISTVSSKTNYDETELITRFVRRAGYKRPTPLQSAVVPLILQGRDLLIESEQGDGKSGTMIIPLLAKLSKGDDPAIKAVVLTGSAEQVQHIQHQYKRFAPRTGSRPSLVAVGSKENPQREVKVLNKYPDILLGTPARIIDHIRRDNISLSDVEYAVLDIPDNVDERGFDKDVLFIFSKMRGKQQTIAFLRDIDLSSAFETILKRPLSVPKTDYSSAASGEPAREEAEMNEKDPINEAISELLKRLKEAENPEILNHYRALFRKNVPLHLRGYIAGMLLREYMGTEPETSEKSRTLFLSIGKNRRVYPKDLLGLFAEKLKVDSSVIGAIKILDSYSFVDVPEKYAEQAIKQLNGTEFRGRTLTVNNARKRRK